MPREHETVAMSSRGSGFEEKERRVDGDVRAFAGNARASFPTRIAYIDKDHAAAAAAAIEGDRP
jgi:hypothetical protein